MPAAPLSPTTLGLVLGRSSDSPLSPIIKVRSGPRKCTLITRLAPHDSQPRHERRVRVQVRVITANQPSLSTSWPPHAHGPGRPALALTSSLPVVPTEAAVMARLTNVRECGEWSSIDP